MLDHVWIDPVKIKGARHWRASRRAFVGPAKHQNILTIPPFGPAIAIDRRTDAIQRDISMFREEFRPVGLQLLVQVIHPALEGYCRRKKNDRSCLHQKGDERFGPVLGQVLRYFERAGKIKAAAKIAQASKVSGPKMIGRDFQQIPRNVIAIDAEIIADAVPLERFEPSANAAADIHDRTAREQRKNNRDHDLRRVCRSILLALIEGLVIGRPSAGLTRRQFPR
jgi:hypothetical protein